MEEVKTWRSADLFMSLKRDLAMVTQQIYVAEDWVKDARNKARDEAQSRMSVEKNVEVIKREKQELAKKLVLEERDRKSAEAGLKRAQDQVEDQRKKLYSTELELVTQRQLVLELKASLEKAKEAAWGAERAAAAEKEAAYLRGIEETKVRLAEELSEVCRDYCKYTWEEALNQAGVPTDSDLRRPERTYFHPHIQDASDPPSPSPTLALESSAQDLTIPETVNEGSEDVVVVIGDKGTEIAASSQVRVTSEAVPLEAEAGSREAEPTEKDLSSPP